MVVQQPITEPARHEHGDQHHHLLTVVVAEVVDIADDRVDHRGVVRVENPQRDPWIPLLPLALELLSLIPADVPRSATTATATTSLASESASEIATPVNLETPVTGTTTSGGIGAGAGGILPIPISTPHTA